MKQNTDNRHDEETSDLTDADSPVRMNHYGSKTVNKSLNDDNEDNGGVGAGRNDHSTPMMMTDDGDHRAVGRFTGRFSQFLSRRSYVLWLSLFAFFYISNPAQPFLVEFLMKQKGLSLETILRTIFPVWTYSMLLVQLFVGVMSELRLFGHKWIIASGIILHVIELYVTLFARRDQVWLLQGTEVAVAWSFSCYQSFFALRYHMTQKSDYHFITGLTRALMLLGNVAGALIGQFMYMMHFEMYTLYYASILCTLPCLIISVVAFPSPSKYVVSIDQKPTLIRGAIAVAAEEKISVWQRLKQLPYQTLSCYLSSFQVSFWSVFGLVAVSVHSLSLTYYQTLFKALDYGHSFNGFLMAVAYLFAGFLSLVPARIESIVDRFGEYICIILSSLCGVCLFFLGYKSIPLVVAYVLFILYHCMFEFLLVISMAQIAKSMKETKFAAVFSINSTLQNVVQVVIQLIIGKNVMNLNALKQFQAFGACMFLSAMLFTFLVIGHKLFSMRRNHPR